MKRIWILTVGWCLVIGYPSFALPETMGSVAQYDAVMTIHESTLNKFLSAIGSISSTGNFNNGATPYSWVVTNPKITISEVGATFTADALVKSGPISYKTIAKGNVDIGYEPTRNMINIKIKKASFEVAMDLLGNKIHITDVDISSYYKPQFEFSGPQPMQSQVIIPLPDKTKKTVEVRSVVKKILVDEGKIWVGSSIEFRTVSPSALATHSADTRL